MVDVVDNGEAMSNWVEPDWWRPNFDLRLKLDNLNKNKLIKLIELWGISYQNKLNIYDAYLIRCRTFVGFILLLLLLLYLILVDVDK